LNVINLAVTVVPCFVTEFYSIVGRYFVTIFMKLFLCVRLAVVTVNTRNSLLLERHLLRVVQLQKAPLPL